MEHNQQSKCSPLKRPSRVNYFFVRFRWVQTRNWNACLTWFSFMLREKTGKCGSCAGRNQTQSIGKQEAQIPRDVTDFFFNFLSIYNSIEKVIFLKTFFAWHVTSFVSFIAQWTTKQGREVLHLNLIIMQSQLQSIIENK